MASPTRIGQAMKDLGLFDKLSNPRPFGNYYLTARSSQRAAQTSSTGLFMYVFGMDMDQNCWPIRHSSSASGLLCPILSNLTIITTHPLV